MSGLPINCAATVPTFEITGPTTPSGYPRDAVFAGGGPPTDGSLAFAFFTVASAMGHWTNSYGQRLAYWNGVVGTDAEISLSGSNITVNVPGWSFI